MPIAGTSSGRGVSCPGERHAIRDRRDRVNRSRRRAIACVAALALSAGGPFTSVSGAAGAAPDVPPATIARLAAIDCERVSAAQVREVLALVPAPRIVLLQGSVAVVTMEPFAQFLIGMGYPEERLRNPADGS